MIAKTCKAVNREEFEKLYEQSRVIDKEAYSEEFKGSENMARARYEKCMEHMIGVFNEDNNLIGHMVIFPISDGLREKIYNSNVVIDDEIEPDEIVDCRQSYTLLVMSVAILKEYRDTEAIKLLINEYGWYLIERAEHIKEVIAETISTDGEKLFRRLGFKEAKQYKDGYKLFKYEV